MNCDVCCEQFNKSTRAQVVCPYCPFSACSGCSERYLVDTTQDAHCMSCRKAWNREILVGNFSNKFVNQVYKSQRESLLLEREKSLMQATQPYVEFELGIRKTNVTISKLRQVQASYMRKCEEINQMDTAVLAVDHSLGSEFEARVLRHKLGFEQRKLANAVAIDIEHLEWYRDRLLVQLHGQVATQERRAFVRACPVGDCRGFLSTAWKCGMCDNWTCPECHEVRGKDKDGPHTCDPNNVETAKLLAKDSRNCPKCASVIFKIDGCFAKDTPILKWDGKLIMSQDITPGTQLIGDDGSVRTVTDICHGYDDLYKVTQKNGIEYIVNSKHKLALKFCGDRTIDANLKLKWFDRETLCSKTKIFETRKEADEFRENLKFDRCY